MGVTGHGMPPPEFQCQAFRRNGRRCRKWRLKGARTCEFHGGRQAQRYVRVDDLPSFYSKRLTRTLRDALKEALEAPPHEQVSLFEELHLVRQHAGDLVELYGKVAETGNLEAMITVGAQMSNALKEVADLALKAKTATEKSTDMVSIHHIGYLVNQIVRLAYNTFSDHQDLAEEFESLIRSDIKLPNQQAGHTITPDQDAIEMNATVPNSPEVV